MDLPTRSEIGAMWLGPDQSPAAEAKRRQRILANLFREFHMSVRAKVVCEGIVANAVKFRTVYEPYASKDTENVRFTQATPWGEIRLGIDNPAALEQFAPGKSYYVDFTPAD